MSGIQLGIEHLRELERASFETSCTILHLFAFKGSCDSNGKRA